MPAAKTIASTEPAAFRSAYVLTRTSRSSRTIDAQHIVRLQRGADHAIDADERQARVTDDEHPHDLRRKGRIIAHQSLGDDRERQALGGHHRK